MGDAYADIPRHGGDFAHGKVGVETDTAFGRSHGHVVVNPIANEGADALIIHPHRHYYRHAPFGLSQGKHYVFFQLHPLGRFVHETQDHSEIVVFPLVAMRFEGFHSIGYCFHHLIHSYVPTVKCETLYSPLLLNSLFRLDLNSGFIFFQVGKAVFENPFSNSKWFMAVQTEIFNHRL